MEDNISQNGGLQIFNYKDQEVRTVTINGEIWWVASDVCDALGIDRTQTRRLDDDEKGVCTVHTLGGDQQMAVVNEPGLYTLVLTSRKPEAKTFKRWITHDVIPAIRKTGSYTSPTQPALPTGFTNNLWLKRSNLFLQKTKIPTNKFCVFEEISHTLYTIEMGGVRIPEHAIPDGSVGGRWKTYARDVLHLDISLVGKYPHHYPDHRGVVGANIYPLEWQGMFTLWFREVYIPECFPEYMKYLKMDDNQIMQVMKILKVDWQIPSKNQRQIKGE